MRLLFLFLETFRAPGGIQMFNRALCRAASDLGPDGLTVLSLRDETAQVDRRYLPLSASDGRGFSGKRGSFVMSALRAARGRVVVLGHTQLLPMSWPLRLAGARRILCQFHGIEAWGPFTRLQALGVSGCDAFVSVSDYTMRRAREAHPSLGKPIHLLPNTLDPFWSPSSRDQRPASDELRLLTVSRLEESERYKGIDTTLRALALARSAGMRARLQIVGDGSDRQRLKGLSQDLGLSDAVDFRGALERDQLLRSYADCDLFVLPSTQEGFGIVYLEAASHRKASLAALGGAAAEMLRDGETGFLVTPDDPHALARKLSDIAGRPGLLESVGERAHAELGERYGFKAFTERLGTLLSG